MPSFQSDPKKSLAKLKNHGIGFDQAIILWDDPYLPEVKARSDDEPRSLIIARLDEHYWSAVVTYRDEEVRIISVRRSRLAEVELYEN